MGSPVIIHTPYQQRQPPGLAFISASFLVPLFFPDKLELTFILLCLGLSAFYGFWTYKSWLKSVRTFQLEVGKIIVLHKGVPKMEIPFQSIHQVIFPVSNRYMGSFTLILNSREKYLFHIGFENLEHLLDALYQARPDLISKSNYEDTRKNLAMNRTWSKVFKSFFGSDNYPFILTTGGLTLAGAWLLNYFQSKEYIIEKYGTLGDIALWSLSLLFIAQGLTIRVLTKKVINQLAPGDFVGHSTAHEKVVKTSKQLTPLYLLAIGIAFVALWKTSWNLFQSADIYRNFPELGLRADEDAWIDYRWNCINCKHPLEKGDVIFLDYLPPGVLVGLPSDTVMANSRYKKRWGHSLFGQEVKLEKSQIAVQYREEGRLITAVSNLDDVKGVLQRENPMKTQTKPAPVEFSKSTVLQPSDFSLSVQQCDAATLNLVLNGISSREHAGLFAPNRNMTKELVSKILADYQNLAKLTSPCPTFAQAISDRTQMIYNLVKVSDQVNVALEMADALKKQTQKQLAILAITPAPTPGLATVATPAPAGMPAAVPNPVAPQNRALASPPVQPVQQPALPPNPTPFRQQSVPQAPHQLPPASAGSNTSR
ncbi:MAG: hypothetical protein HYX41_06000 [Bdellovibrio sp.]|nr:hypothetical protein [Bdellovibrio sp.]